MTIRAPVAVVIAATTACAAILELEPSVPYGGDDRFVFPACSAATRALLCEEDPAPPQWPPALDPRDGGACKSAIAAGAAGGGLEASCLASSAPDEGGGWCNTRVIRYGGEGARIRIKFRVAATPSRDRFGLLALDLPPQLLFVIELAENRIVATPLDFNGSVLKPPPPATNDLGLLDDQWHEIAFHIAADGHTNVVYDGHLAASPLELGPLGGSGSIVLDVLDATRADVATTVTIDDVVVLPY